jgi:hypothetical protein
MRFSDANVSVLLLSICVAGCASEDPPAQDGPIEAIELSLHADECRGPRPRNRGCSVMCKPCSFAVCEDGKWVYERVDWGDECNGGGGLGGGGGCCEVPIWGGCPAECSCCTY